MLVYAMLQTEEELFFKEFCKRKLEIYCTNTRMLKLYQNVLYMKLLHYWYYCYNYYNNIRCAI